MMRIASALAFASCTSLFVATASAQQVTLYTAGPAPLATALAKGFEKKSGAKVNVFQATTGQIMARLAAEKSNPQADVLISASWDAAEDMKTAGDLLAYTSPNAKNVPADLKDEYFVAQGAAALAIIWNPKSGKPRPADWADLAKPEYANAVTMPDPASSGAAYGLLSSLIADTSYGWKTFERLKANGLIVPGANAQALNPVMSGAKAAVMGGADYIALDARANGEAIEVIYPSSGTVLEARPIMIFKTTKNADTAKRFVDYVLSDEGQQLVAGAYLLPARTDITAKRPGWHDIKLIKDTDNNSVKRTETLAKFKALMAGK
ncbi:ABC transporter substrate-binding protein [Uliginosibacterium sp. H3]|uniref:ABC transporter substrate-binding protein n=1 Tax=Uliginosibacterium silvisoli TaxID=3114758 RepID=A0ABU6K6P9_9RHOO|nr:ABC transporter substrate-binding protein [Uliginosibacterium sp. H3]